MKTCAESRSTLARLVPLFGLAALLTLGACTGPGFSRDYRRATDAFATADPRPAVAGPWEGYWKSSVNGHTGKLRAIATPAEGAASSSGDAGSGDYLFRYHATWAKVLSGGYEAPHRVEPAGGGRFRVSAEKDIALLGTYVSEGVVDGARFESSYRSKADSGVFVLERPE